MRSSRIQARLLADYAGEIGFALEEGPSPWIRFPDAGPYDERLGHARFPAVLSRLEERGFRVVAQARPSERLRRVVELGLFPPYREKVQAGLALEDRLGRSIYRASYPKRVFESFEEIPDLVVRSLLFLENRELLDETRPHLNPAVEWDRLALATLGLFMRSVSGTGPAFGASTLATQMEKYRHSPEGVTGSPVEKLRQMASASLRAYLHGPRTVETRRRIVLDYLNSVPLAAAPGYGEVTGLGDGLWAWYGLELDEVRRLLHGLSGGTGTDEGLEAAARAYRAALGLLLAHRRPSWYLTRQEGREALERLTDAHLRLFAEQGLLPPRVAEASLGARVPLRDAPPLLPRSSFVERKAANALRIHLMGLLGVGRLYELDRLDLAVRAHLDQGAQDSVTSTLLRLREPAYVQSSGFDGLRLLGAGDPGKVIYSFLLYEGTPTGHVIRVQTDNFEGPFDLNQASRLELGSTAKLRALVTYLQVAEELHLEFAGLATAAFEEAAAGAPGDPLTRWAIEFLRARPEATRREMLEAAMERRYSANPGERFFTGGGTHVFQNFDRTFDGSVLTVREGFRHSVNLVFVRLMRDVVRYHTYRVPGSSARVLEDPGDPRRRELLARFADREGRQFVRRFHREHAGKSREEMLDRLVEGRRLSPQRLAWVFRSVAPEEDVAAFADFLRRRSPDAAFSERAVEDLFRRADPTALDLADRGYLAGVHPLELWTVAFLLRNPDAGLEDALRESGEARQEVYRWLFRSGRRTAQDRRIRILLEVEAFLEIARSWQRLGYPFENVVPSFGTAIGSSGDRPGALAELIGILLTDGVRYPVVRLDELRFGSGTPYETVLGREPARGVRVLSREVAGVSREALIDVVEQGTARGVAGAFRTADGTPLPVGGKTGTGHNQYKVFGPGGRLLEARTVNRTATFVFTVGDRFFGVVTAHVPGPEAADYRFTSALPVRLLRHLAPALEPALEPALTPR